MGDFPDFWFDSPFPSGNPPPTPQLSSIGGSPEGGVAPGSILPTNPGRIFQPASIPDRPKATSLNFDLTGSGIDMQRTCSDGSNWRHYQAQALNDVSGQDWDSAIVSNLRYNESDFRKVRLQIFACADSC
jgi:hypothetical protein